MNKKILSMAARIVSAAVILIFASACSDGQHSAPTASMLPAKVVPAITKFQISKIGGTEPAGKSATIELGDSVLLEWEVAVGGAAASGGGTVRPKAAAGAGGSSTKDTKPKITLDAEALNIHKEDMEAKGSVVISSAIKDAEFVLTVTSGKDVVTDKVDVKVVAKKQVSEPLVTDNGTQTVEERKKIEIKEFKAEPDTNEGQLIDWLDVTLSWKVEPSNAVVTISPLPEGKEFKAEDSTKVNVSTTTTFLLTAYYPDHKSSGVTKTATVTINPPREIALNASGGGVVFAGEEAVIKWAVAYKTGCAWPPANEATVVIKGGAFGDAGQSQRGASGEVKVEPAETTEYTIEASAPNALPAAPAKVKVSVRNWKGPGADKISVDAAAKTTNAVSSLGFSRASHNIIYAGYDGKLMDVPDETGAKAKGFSIARGIVENPYWEALNIPFMKIFPPMLGKRAKNNVEFFNQLKYPVNVITTDPKNANRIYIGTTGGVFYTNDGGKKWNILTAMFLDSDVQLPHTTCNGKESAGWPGLELHGLSQVCDIEIAPDGRFIVATDMTVEYLPQGVDASLEEKGYVKDSKWEGFAELVTGQVNYDLELVNSDGVRDVLFVGTPQGILRSPDMGETYERIEGNGAPNEDIYSIKIDLENHALYAGSDGKIYVCLFNDYDCKAWHEAAVGSGDGVVRVYSLALDPVRKGGVFAAASKGVFYSTDGTSWKDVTSSPMTAGTMAMSVKGVKSGDGKKGTVYVGTSQGVFVSTSEIVDASDGAASLAQPVCLAPKKMIPSTLVIKKLLQ